jgi:hypothetical protein
MDARNRKFKELLDKIIGFSKEEEVPLSEVGFSIVAALFNYRKSFVKSLNYSELSDEDIGVNISGLKAQKKKKIITEEGEAILNALEIEQKKRLENKRII